MYKVIVGDENMKWILLSVMLGDDPHVLDMRRGKQSQVLIKKGKEPKMIMRVFE